MIRSICQASDVPQGLSQVTAKGVRFLLSREGDRIRAFSAVCPHQGGAVECTGSGFRCPIHFWTFGADGRATNAREQGLHEFEVRVVDGAVRVEVDRFADDTHLQGRVLDTDLEVELVAHACVTFRHSGTTLVVDPWLDGPAFNGAWVQYPPPSARGDELTPDMVLLTHEHSDHFHPETLVRIGDVPIFYPDFPNRRIGRVLDKHGFTRHRACAFGEPVEVAEGVRVTFFEPASLWNDSIVLIEFPDCNILNLNDAGLNRRIARYLPAIDLVMSSFNPGASGYPMTWDHVTEEEKRAYYLRARDGQLAMLRQIVDAYGARLVLPFASYFTLWHPSHRSFLPLLAKNTPADVRRAFEGTDVGVLDLLPGDRWNGRTGAFTRRYGERQAERLFDQDRISAWVDRHFDMEVFAAFHPMQGTVSDEAVVAYFRRFEDSPHLPGCEELEVRLEVGDRVFHFDVGPRGVRRIEPDEGNWNLRICTPEPLLARIIAEDLSWDEAHIGYWLRFERRPDVFHAGFWRMLQAPYYCKGSVPVALDADVVLDELLERHPEVDPVLRRYGMYCSICGRRPLETLRQAARFHGLPDDQKRRLIEELAAVVSEGKEAAGVRGPLG